jgi:crossover junction endodeoxyribonuclease RuvC
MSDKVVPVRIIGIDPGYDRVGWAVGDARLARVQPVEFGCIVTDRKAPLFARYQQIMSELEGILARLQPQEAAIETLFFSKNRTTAMDVSEARGVILSSLLGHQVECFEYSPVAIKQAVTGFGQADKKAVEKMVVMQLGLQMHMSQHRELDDTLDALAILLTHAVSRSTLRVRE